MPRLSNMTLEQKGNFQPPIKLPKNLEVISQFVQALEGVTSATHWDLYDLTQADGADFYVGKFELGHIHLDGDVHLPLTAELGRKLLKCGAVSKAPWGYGWYRFEVKSKADAQHAIALFKINYLRLMKAKRTEVTSAMNQLG